MAAALPLTPVGPSPARRAVLTRRVRLFVAATITYNAIEAAVALTAGTLASSTALMSVLRPQSEQADGCADDCCNPQEKSL